MGAPAPAGEQRDPVLAGGDVGLGVLPVGDVLEHHPTVELHVAGATVAVCASSTRALPGPIGSSGVR